ncbi:MAG: MarC family protein [Myxococcaceae bacterium]|nr:MarC family protein [Myxococcaceae bacterium]MBH2006372.1 MarC family protein [Myxococcaceae bacterium]
MSLFSLSLTFALILHPTGHQLLTLNKIFESYLKSKRLRYFAQEMALTLIMLIIFHYIGVLLQNSLHIGLPTIRIAAGVILFVISLKMIFPDTFRRTAHELEAPHFLVPVASPILAGPMILTTIMVYSSGEAPILVIPAILVAWTIVSLSLVLCWKNRSLIHPKLVTAYEQLIGLVIMMLSVEMFLKGIRLLWN